jgi:APA family basic amino acid/polyamine antiporter
MEKKYGLFTTIAMIVGIVIGSGIFFKANNILIATGGSVLLGVLVFCIAAFAIIFGCLTISNLAALTDEPGGISAYAQRFLNDRFAAAFGWFQTFIYFPTITVVVSWAVGIFVSNLSGIEANLETQMLIGFGWFVLCYLYNVLSASLGAAFQDFSTVVKMIPLVLIGVFGMLWGSPVTTLFHETGQGAVNSHTALGWLAAIGPIAFTFDGWIVSTNVAFEVKDSKKNLPRALVIAPLLILGLYLLYFVGLSSYLRASQIMELGESAVFVAAQRMIGGIGGTAVLIFVIISVMGTVNGLVLAFIRVPYSLARKGWIPKSDFLAKIGEKSAMPLRSGVLSFVICLVWWVVHYFTMKFEILFNSDVSEISIAVSYLIYMALYFQVFRMWKDGRIKGKWKGLVFPFLATLGSLFMLSGGLQNQYFVIYVVICLVPLVLGYLYGRKA